MRVRKPTEEQVREARIAYQRGAEASEVMAAMGVNWKCFYRFITGQTFKSAGGPTVCVARLSDRKAERKFRERIAELEERCDSLQLALDEVTAPPPAFCNLGLPQAQMRLLGALMRRPGMPVTTASLMAATGTESWGSVKTQISRVRKSVPGIAITSVFGVGYVARYVS